MSHVVRRSLIGVALGATVATATGCGGSGPDAAAGTSASPSTADSRPAPSGDGCAAVGDAADLAELDLIDVVNEIPTTQTFAAYLAAAVPAQQQFGSLTGVTAFVPVDSAWTKLDEATAAQLTDVTWQQALVEYSLVPAEHPPEAFGGSDTAAMPTFRAPDAVLSGQTVSGTIVLNGQASVVCAAVPFDGGLLYLVDTVMLPPS